MLFCVVWMITWRETQGNNIGLLVLLLCLRLNYRGIEHFRFSPWYMFFFIYFGVFFLFFYIFFLWTFRVFDFVARVSFNGWYVRGWKCAISEIDYANIEMWTLTSTSVATVCFNLGRNVQMAWTFHSFIKETVYTQC